VTSYRVTVVFPAGSITDAHSLLFAALDEQDVKYTSFEIEEF
jgi:hypothetical protein